MSFSSARLFCEVARARSLSQAARQLGVTQPAASQRLKQLEERLGVRLVNRATRPLQLTPAGEAYLQGARMALDALDKAESDARRIALEAGETPAIQGVAHVSAIYSAGMGILARCADLFAELHPQAKLELDFRTPDEVAKRVTEGKADLGVASYPNRYPGVQVKILREEPLLLACQKNHPLASKTTIAPGDLDGVDMLGFVLDLPLARRIERHLKEHSAKARVSMRFDNIDTLKSAITTTGKPGILPQQTIEGELETGSLVGIPLSPALTRPLGLIHARNAELGSAAQAFAEILISQSTESDA